MMSAEAIPAFYDDALCAQVDPEAWFPQQGTGSRTAKKVSARCPVAAACLEYAVVEQITSGVWGGKTPVERRRMRSERAA